MKRGMMFRRRRNNRLSLDNMAEEIKKSEIQRDSSRELLKEAKESASVLNRIREENHIVMNLREVFGGR